MTDSFAITQIHPQHRVPATKPTGTTRAQWTKRMLKHLQHVVLTGIFALLPLAVVEANMVTNGSFETPDITTGTYQIFTDIPGWTTSFGDGIEIQDHIAGSPYDGDQHVELAVFNNRGMLQQIATGANQSYLLSFAYSPRPGRDADSNIIKVYFGNA